MSENSINPTLLLIEKVNLFENYFSDAEHFVLYLPLWVVNAIAESSSGFPAHSKMHVNMLKRVCYKLRSFDRDDYKGGINLKNMLKHIANSDTYWPDDKEMGEWIETYYHATDMVVKVARDRKYRDYEENEVFNIAYDQCFMLIAESFLKALDETNPYKEVEIKNAQEGK